MQNKNDKELLPNLFRTEYSKIVAVLCRSFGLNNIQFAEDIASDTFLKASETWGLKGVPTNPKAWLYTVAKNRAKDQFKRLDLYYDKVIPILHSRSKFIEEIEVDFTKDNLNDSLLQMIFTVCNPVLRINAQLTLALRVLCGFNVDEIANALLTTKSNINKRLVRAKLKFKELNIQIELPEPKDIPNRLNSVLRVLYLLFNEGYFSTTTKNKIRHDLCFEAMRLLHLLTQYKMTNLSDINALMALFCFHTSRFDSRLDKEGNQILFQEQQKEQWNTELIQKGEYFLSKTNKNSFHTKYHLEAMIAFMHSRKTMGEKTKWENVLSLYNRLIIIEKSPMTLLNRCYVVAKVHGKEQALTQIKKIPPLNHPLYFSLLADLYDGIDENKRREYLERAIDLCKNENDKLLLKAKLQSKK